MATLTGTPGLQGTGGGSSPCPVRPPVWEAEGPTWGLPGGAQEASGRADGGGSVCPGKRGGHRWDPSANSAPGWLCDTGTRATSLGLQRGIFNMDSPAA